MFSQKIQQVKTYFRNMILTSDEEKNSIEAMMDDGKVTKVIDMMVNNEIDIDNAISEYTPQLHKVMRRKNKWVKGEEPYITEKLPRSRQKYINEVELFFLLGNPIVWKKKKGSDEGFSFFLDFLNRKIYFNKKIRQCKRLAGSETESALVFSFSQKDGKMHVECFVAARSLGYKIRTLYDQFGNIMCGAVGYKLNKYGKNVDCWDVFTLNYNYHCENNGILGWGIQKSINPTGKINMIHFRQEKAWAGVEPRIDREEMLDSRAGDNNNYFSDPIAAATADVIQSIPKRDKPGKLIQMSDKNSRFEYINPPQNSESRNAEKEDLKNSILFDTFTPDMSPDVMKSMSTLTSVGIKRALVLGFIKRSQNIDIYGELVERLLHVIIKVLEALYPERTSELEDLDISFEFSEPFNDDKKEMWRAIAELYSSGVISLDTAVRYLSLTDAPDEEIAKIRQDKTTTQNGKE